MVGILLISHGTFCEHLMKSAAMIAGEVDKTQAIPLQAGESPDLYGERIKKAVEELDEGDGVLVLVDMLGGTPYNQIGSLSRDLNVQIVTGMNLTMLMYLTLEKNETSTLTELADNAADLAQQAIKVIRRK